MTHAPRAGAPAPAPRDPAVPADGGDPGAGVPLAVRFRAFVRRHHPDVGGDPEVFRRGVAAFRAGRSPFEAVPPGAQHLTWAVPDDDPRLDAPVVAAADHVVGRTVRAGRRWLGRTPLRPVRTRRVV